jgi:hypothetical protein
MYTMHYLCKLSMYGSMLPVDVFPVPGSGFPLLSATVIFFPHTSCHFPNLARCRTEDGGNIFLQRVGIRLLDVHSNSGYNTKCLNQVYLINSVIQSDKCTYFLTYSMGRALLEKPTGSQLVNIFPAFYGTRKFITTFSSARHLSYPEPVRSSP